MKPRAKARPSTVVLSNLPAGTSEMSDDEPKEHIDVNYPQIMLRVGHTPQKIQETRTVDFGDTEIKRSRLIAVSQSKCLNLE
jgi:hypothetical protein